MGVFGSSYAGEGESSRRASSGVRLSADGFGLGGGGGGGGGEGDASPTQPPAHLYSSTRYDDVFGPVALVVILCVVATASITLSAASVDWNRHAYARPTRS